MYQLTLRKTNSGLTPSPPSSGRLFTTSVLNQCKSNDGDRFAKFHKSIFKHITFSSWSRTHTHAHTSTHTHKRTHALPWIAKIFIYFLAQAKIISSKVISAFLQKTTWAIPAQHSGLAAHRRDQERPVSPPQRPPTLAANAPIGTYRPQGGTMSCHSNLFKKE